MRHRRQANRMRQAHRKTYIISNIRKNNHRLSDIPICMAKINKQRTVGPFFIGSRRIECVRQLETHS